MNLKQLLTDEQAVSSVIGVILMVALVVILAAVVGVYVFTVDAGPEPPESTIDTNWDSMDLWIAYKGGDTLSSDNTGQHSACTTEGLGITVDGSDAGCWEAPISAGENYRIGNNSGADVAPPGGRFEGGEEVRIIWVPPGGGSSQTLAEQTIPEQIPCQGTC